MSRISSQTYGVNVCAFLDTLAHSEGTTAIAGSDDGYNVLVGGGLFHSYATHPLAQGILLEKLGYYSTAAGRYQLLHRYFLTYARKLQLPDFAPGSQDLIALEQLKEQGAVRFIRAGDFSAAVNACRHVWASLPGAGYGQHENTLASLDDVYRDRLTTYSA